MDEDEKYQFLDDEAPAEPEVEVPQAETVEQPVEVAPEPDIPAPEATTAPEREQEMVPYAALKAERRKRQEYEAQLQQFQQTQQFDPSVFYQDPRAIQEYVDTRMAHSRVELSREMALAQFPDYAELEEVFVEAARQNPLLVSEMLQHGSPALYAYNTAKAMKTVKEAQSGDLERRLRAEIEAKVRAEFKAQPANVPPDLSNVRSAAVPQAEEDMSLDSILQSRKR